MEKKSRTQLLIAVLGVVGALGVAAISNWDKIWRSQTPVIRGQEPVPVPVPVPEPVPVPGPTPSFSEWPLIADETFTDSDTKWRIWTGPPSERIERQEVRIVGGKYRWDIAFKRNWERYQLSPYPPAINFYVAVDVRFIEFDQQAKPNAAASLLFGTVENKGHTFRLGSGGAFAVYYFDGKAEHRVLWTPSEVDPKDANRLAVLVDDGHIKLFVNSSLVGEFRDPTFTGGGVGLSVSAAERTAVVVDFDNFEFRRKP